SIHSSPVSVGFAELKVVELFRTAGLVATFVGDLRVGLAGVFLIFGSTFVEDGSSPSSEISDSVTSLFVVSARLAAFGVVERVVAEDLAAVLDGVLLGVDLVGVFLISGATIVEDGCSPSELSDGVSSCFVSSDSADFGVVERVVAARGFLGGIGLAE